MLHGQPFVSKTFFEHNHSYSYTQGDRHTIRHMVVFTIQHPKYEAHNCNRENMAYKLEMFTSWSLSANFWIHFHKLYFYAGWVIWNNNGQLLEI